jgi:hypothetical protein
MIDTDLDGEEWDQGANLACCGYTADQTLWNTLQSDLAELDELREETRWRDVEEEPPDRRWYSVVRSTDSDGPCDMYCSELEWQGEWVDEWGETCTDVICWRPRPKPPEEKETTNEG